MKNLSDVNCQLDKTKHLKTSLWAQGKFDQNFFPISNKKKLEDSSKMKLTIRGRFRLL